MQQIANGFKWLANLPAGVQNAIIIVLTAIVLLTAVAAWLIPELRSQIISVLTLPFRVVGELFYRHGAIEGSLIRGFKPRVTFSVSADPSADKRRIGTATFDGRFYNIPVYVKISGKRAQCILGETTFSELP